MKIFKRLKWAAIRLYLIPWFNKFWEAIKERYRNGG